MTNVLALAAAYLLGGIPFGYLLVWLKTRQDVRELGSGNIGATNVLRTQGRVLGVATLLLDVLKGAGAVALMNWSSSGDARWLALSAVAVMLGHAYPVFLRFKGGKAVASMLGAFLYLTPAAVGAAALVFVVVVAASRFISLGSIISAGTFPLAVFLILHSPWPIQAAAVVCAAFIVWRHQSNIERLRAGTENVFRFGRVRGRA